MNSERSFDTTVTKKDILKFAIASIIGGFMFLVPVPYKEAFTIPLGIIIGFVEDLLVVNDFDIAELLVLVFIAGSVLLTILAHTIKPGFIMNNENMKNLFLASPLYFISRVVALVITCLVFFNIGPEQITSEDTGGSMMYISALMISIVFVISFAIPLLTEFGIMEFFGVLLSKVVRFLFTCPGRSSVDLMTSWFGASCGAVIITRGQHERGFYTGREAAVICTNFSIVSIPFAYAISRVIGIDAMFPIWYLVVFVTGMILAAITPRIWPLSRIPDTYEGSVGKQIDEVVPENIPLLKWAVNLAGKRAKKTTAGDVVRFGLHTYLTLFLDLIPLVIAWGTIALVIVEFTPVFRVISTPFGWYMSLFGIEGAMELAPTALVGFVDMYIPALMLSAADAAISTKFIIGALSIIQIIYITEVGILIMKSRIPLNAWQLFVLFIERTLLAIPIIVLVTKLLVNF